MSMKKVFLLAVTLCVMLWPSVAASKPQVPPCPNDSVVLALRSEIESLNGRLNTMSGVVEDAMDSVRLMKDTIVMLHDWQVKLNAQLDSMKQESLATADSISRLREELQHEREARAEMISEELAQMEQVLMRVRGDSAMLRQQMDKCLTDLCKARLWIYYIPKNAEVLELAKSIDRDRLTPEEKTELEQCLTSLEQYETLYNEVEGVIREAQDDVRRNQPLGNSYRMKYEQKIKDTQYYKSGGHEKRRIAFLDYMIEGFLQELRMHLARESADFYHLYKY